VLLTGSTPSIKSVLTVSRTHIPSPPPRRKPISVNQSLTDELLYASCNTVLCFPPNGPTMLYEDNTGAIALAQTGHFKGRSKHFDLRLKWVVDMMDLGLFKLDHETIATVSLDDLFIDDVESPSDTEVKEINDILEQTIELSSTVPCFNPLKERNFSSSLKGGTDVDNGDIGKRRLRSDSGKDAEAKSLSEHLTEVATEQMSAPNCCQRSL
jgi:hypothetical protein